MYLCNVKNAGHKKWRDTFQLFGCALPGYNIIINNSNNNDITVRKAAIVVICMNKKGISFLRLHVFVCL